MYIPLMIPVGFQLPFSPPFGTPECEGVPGQKANTRPVAQCRPVKPLRLIPGNDNPQPITARGRRYFNLRLRSHTSLTDLTRKVYVYLRLGGFPEIFFAFSIASA